MNPKITIITEGVKESKVESVLNAISDIKLKKIGQDRGLAVGAVNVVKYVAEFIGGSTKVADTLLEQTTRQLAGASIRIKFGDVEVEVTNANRSQLVELLDKASEMSKMSSNL